MNDLCPICNSPVEELDEHVWMRHVVGRECWCGVRYRSSFKRHCELNGGYLAHYLESRSGVERG